MDKKGPRLAEVLAFLDAAHRLRRVLDDRAREVTGVTLQQATVLCLIDLLGGEATISQLAERLQRVTHTITARVDRLERNGLVRRDRNTGEDHRQTWVRMTPEGAAKLATYRQAAGEIFNAALADRSAQGDSQSFTQVLSTLTELLGG